MAKVDNRLTCAKSLFRLRNTSCFLKVLNSDIFTGSNRACSNASATYPAFSCWEFLMDASERRGAPSRIRGGAQIGTPTWVLALFSTRFCFVLGCLALFWSSVSLGRGPLPHFPKYWLHWSLFLLWSAGSTQRGWVGGGRWEFSLGILLGHLAPRGRLHHVQEAGHRLSLYSHDVWNRGGFLYLAFFS